MEGYDHDRGTRRWLPLQKGSVPNHASATAYHRLPLHLLPASDRVFLLRRVDVPNECREEIGVRLQFFRYRPCRQLVKISIEIPDCVFLQTSHTMAALTSMLHIRVGDGGTDDDGFVGV